MSRPFVAASVLLACLPVLVLCAPAPERRREDVLAKNQTVILGTWTWKIEGNKFGGGESDFWWEQVSEKERDLVPQGGAGWAIVEKAFEKITRDDLAQIEYSTGKLPGSSLAVGTVVAVRTADGKFAKLKVVGYRGSHDTSFPEAKNLSPAWIAFARGRPNTPEYHLEVNWVLYKPKK
jgi:hypothetical protein